MLLINISEFVSLSLSVFGDIFAHLSNASKNIHSNNNDTISSCANVLAHSVSLDISLMYEDPINSIIMSTGEAGMILSLAFSICLMKYLHETFHDINSNPFRYIKRLLLFTVPVVVSLIIMGAVPQLMILHIVILPIVDLVYFVIWIQASRIFYRTLRWRALELRIRGNSERVARRAVISCYQFQVIMWCIGLGSFGLTLRQFLDSIFSLITIATYYGPCILHYLYGIPFYEPLIVTQKQIEVFLLSHEIQTIVNTILSLTIFLLIGLQYLLGTALFFGRILINKLKYRFGYVRVRFTPSLTSHLLSEQ